MAAFLPQSQVLYVLCGLLSLFFVTATIETRNIASVRLDKKLDELTKSIAKAKEKLKLRE